MTNKQKERNRAFIADLRANTRRAFGKMRGKNGGRCCLCVAYDTAQRMGACLPPPGSVMPPQAMKDWYGWDSVDPELTRYGHEGTASELNDSEEYTHAEIADFFEETFLKRKA